MHANFRSWILLVGDFVTMHVALALTLLVRGGTHLLQDFWSLYFLPFSVLSIAWIVVFFIVDLYSSHHFRVSGKFMQAFIQAMIVNTLFTVFFFYLTPSLGITPKTNLIIYVLVFFGLFIVWRSVAGKYMTSAQSYVPIAFLETDSSSFEKINSLHGNPLSLYRIVAVFHPSDMEESLHQGIFSCSQFSEIPGIIQDNNVEMLVVGREAYRRFRMTLYSYVMGGVDVLDAPTFWEDYHGQIPISLADESWFLNNLSKATKREYELIKRIFDVCFVVSAGAVLALPAAVIAAMIKFANKGPVLYKQTRVGKYEQEFTLYKFRTMVVGAEKDGPQWSQDNDPRVTFIGKILRHTHLDEIPQLWNILKGEMSVIGPRPERPEFVVMLKEEVPFYGLRHLVKPGITGWAQIRYRYGSSVDDTKEKLAYDLYYIKHRSWFIDLKILLKTFSMLFRGEGRKQN